MASAALSMVNSSPLQANGRGFSEFAGLCNTSASAPFARKASHLDLLSVVAFQTSAVNLEYLGRVVFNSYGMLYPDSVVGTDSHTTMIDGLGVAGCGVGCIEAEAVMLGQRGRLEEQVRQHNERRAAAISEMND